MNKVERQIMKIIAENRLPYRYVAGKVDIGGKFPDFVSEVDKTVIEVFGRFFHDPTGVGRYKKVIPFSRTEWGTKEHYKKHGYDVVVLWTNNNGLEDDEISIIHKLKKK